MKIEFWVVGKTSFDYLKDGIELYKKRLGHYCKFEIQIIPDLKNRKKLTENQIKEKEGAVILDKLQGGDYFVLLDERGKTFSSIQFSKYIEKQKMQSHKRVIFLVGGAYGFSEAVYKRSQSKISLSPMTFSHQMIRLFFVEQLYRAFTIMNNEPYHHE
jgi:23S rRNA (pseudouridine1915-N3)-methyltransferase